MSEMKGFSGKEYNLNSGDFVVHPNLYGHKDIEFELNDYDILCGEIVRNFGDGGRIINLDICKIIKH